MEHTNISNQLCQKMDNCTQMRVYLLDNQTAGDGGKIYLFPNDPENEIEKDYKELFKFFVGEKEIVDYSLTDAKKGTLQKILCNELPLWNIIKNQISGVRPTNATMFTPEMVNNKIKMVVVDCIIGKEHIYLLSKYINKTVYSKKMQFTMEGGVFKKIKNAIFTLDENIDCFVFNDSMYIVSESRFDVLFDFHQKINKLVQEQLANTVDWDFFDNNEFAADLYDKPRKSRQFLKVMSSDNLTMWKAKTPLERKEIIINDEKLKDKFVFNEENKIIYTKTVLNDLFKLLTDDYYRSIITGRTGER